MYDDAEDKSDVDAEEVEGEEEKELDDVEGRLFSEDGGMECERSELSANALLLNGA